MMISGSGESTGNATRTWSRILPVHCQWHWQFRRRALEGAHWHCGQRRRPGVPVYYSTAGGITPVRSIMAL